MTYFLAPHSRYTEVRKSDILKHPELMILAESEEAGVFLVMSRDGSQIFVQGHPEYDRMTLNNEYHRDSKQGPESGSAHVITMSTMIRFQFLPLTWRNTSNTLYTNWLNYYVYQTTPYVLDAGGVRGEVKPEKGITVENQIFGHPNKSMSM
ncbi:MAG: homoserine O-acetyltransferase/O-succinyltransferase family protein [Enterocloster bolteae]